jgi:hypothetical protein
VCFKGPDRFALASVNCVISGRDSSLVVADYDPDEIDSRRDHQIGFGGEAGIHFRERLAEQAHVQFLLDALHIISVLIEQATRQNQVLTIDTLHFLKAQLPDVGMYQDAEMDLGRVVSIELSVEVDWKCVDFLTGKNLILDLLFHVLEASQLVLWSVVSLARLDAESSRMPQRHSKRMDFPIRVQRYGREAENVGEFRDRVHLSEAFIEIVIAVEECPAGGVGEIVHSVGSPNSRRQVHGGNECREGTIQAVLIEVSAGQRGWGKTAGIETIDDHVSA